MLGYGNATALVNDPRAHTRLWEEPPPPPAATAAATATAAGAGEAEANCVVVPVAVRGVVLPVLVASRDVEAGEQLLLDYGGEGWWRALAPAWENVEFDGASPGQLLYGPDGPAALKAALSAAPRQRSEAGAGGSGAERPPLAQLGWAGSGSGGGGGGMVSGGMGQARGVTEGNTGGRPGSRQPTPVASSVLESTVVAANSSS